MLIPFGFFGGGKTADFQLISTQVLASTATSVTFSSIPSTFKHLQVRYVVRQSTTGTIATTWNFNGDSGANYAWHRMYGNGGSVGSDGTNAANQILSMTGPGGTDASGIFLVGIADILDYGSTAKNKTIRYATGSKNTSTTNFVALTSGLWTSTAAVTSMTLGALSGSFAIGSRFSLYGWN